MGKLAKDPRGLRGRLNQTPNSSPASPDEVVAREPRIIGQKEAEEAKLQSRPRSSGRRLVNALCFLNIPAGGTPQ